MSNVRALLKAKRQEVQVNHPLAAYTANGQLRCLACGTIVKEGTSWNGHVGNKAHRMNAARLREEERRQELQREEELSRQKRVAAEVDSDEDVEAEPKRRRISEPEDETTNQPATAAGFPADFFSDSSRAPPPPSSDDGSGDEGMPPVPPPAPPSAIDQEWERFQATVLSVPDTHETYERATVFAEPILAEETPEGFPPQDAQTDGIGEIKDYTNEVELRRRKELDERELIMDRLLDEEQAQEEADAKVYMLKSRLEALKKRRDAARAAKGKLERT